MIADENRLKILSLLLNRGELCVCKIIDELDLPQSLISHHLAILRDIGLVNSRRKGRWIHYSINTKTLEELNAKYLTLFGRNPDQR
ncbi:MAG: metalloregulator ArsR/SmtB family transcription factor [Actinomycetota bacterium]